MIAESTPCLFLCFCNPCASAESHQQERVWDNIISFLFGDMWIFSSKQSLTWTLNVTEPLNTENSLCLGSSTNVRQSHPHILGNKPWFIPRFGRKLFPAERSVTLLLSDHVNLPNSRCDLQLLESGKISDNRQLLIHFHVILLGSSRAV